MEQGCKINECTYIRCRKPVTVITQAGSALLVSHAQVIFDCFISKQETCIIWAYGLVHEIQYYDQ